MNESILEKLGSIYALLSLILFIFFIQTVVKAIVGLTRWKRQALQSYRGATERHLEELFAEDKLPQLISQAENELKTKPNDVLTLSWLLRAHYGQQNWREAERLVFRLRSIDPSYIQSTLPYLEEARRNLEIKS